MNNFQQNVSQTTVISGSIEDVRQKLTLLKNTRVFEDEQSFLDILSAFITTMAVAAVKEEKGAIMVDITSVNGKLDKVLVSLNGLTTEMRLHFEDVDKRLDGVDKRLDGIDNRLKQVEDDTRIIRTVINGAKRISKYLPKSN